MTDFTASRLGVNPSGGLSVLDWLSVTGQSVLEVTAGPAFTDRTRALAAVRTMLAWYPPDVERYVLGAGWQRLCQLLPMVGRTAEAGDELGSRLLSASLADDLLWLAFALSRRWAPYAKWRGTVFRTLPVAARLGPLLDAAAAPAWRERENALTAACEVLLDIQRERGLPTPEPAVIPFFDRPYRTLDGAVPRELLDGITDPDVRRLPPMVGSIEQWADSVDVLSSPGRRAALQAADRAVSDTREGGTVRELAVSQGCQGQPVADLARQAIELRPAAVGGVLLSVEQADPQARRPGVLNLMLGPPPPGRPLVAGDELLALSDGGGLIGRSGGRPDRRCQADNGSLGLGDDAVPIMHSQRSALRPADVLRFPVAVANAGGGGGSIQPLSDAGGGVIHPRGPGNAVEVSALVVTVRP